MASELAIGIPNEVPKLWLVRAMRQLGWYDAFKAILTQADEDTREDWQLCQDLKRSDVNVNAIAGLMEKTAADIDALFQLADQLQQAG